MQRRVYINGVWEDVLLGTPPFHVGQRVCLTRHGVVETFVCTEISTDAIRLQSKLAVLDFASRFEAALWS